MELPSELQSELREFSLVDEWRMAAWVAEEVREKLAATKQLAYLEAGVVKKRFGDQRQYGFIHAADGDYYFHLTDLDPDLRFEDVEEGMEVEFDVAKRPSIGRNGHAQHVRRRACA